MSAAQPIRHSVETIRYLRDGHLKQARYERSVNRQAGVTAAIEYAREWHRELMQRMGVAS